MTESELFKWEDLDQHKILQKLAEIWYVCNEVYMVGKNPEKVLKKLFRNVMSSATTYSTEIESIKNAVRLLFMGFPLFSASRKP